MADSASANRLLLEAASFAARAHRNQVRKDGHTPYAAHPFRVCLIVRHVFGIDNPEALVAALLHDTIEDTTTDYDHLHEKFGTRVANWVATLTKDMRLPDEDREADYVAGLANADPAVKLAKLADIFDNLTDSAHLTPAGRRRTVLRSRRYLAALASDLPDSVASAIALVQKLVDEVAATDRIV